MCENNTQNSHLVLNPSQRIDTQMKISAAVRTARPLSMLSSVHLFQPSTEMARAVTMESIGEAAGAGSGPLSCHNTCRGWLGVPAVSINAASSCTGPAHLRHSHHRPHPLQAVYLPYQQGPVMAPALMSLPSPPSSQRDEAEAGSISGQLSGNILPIWF